MLPGQTKMIKIIGNHIMLTTSNGGAKFAVPLGVYAFEDHNPGSYIYGIPHNDGYGLSVEEHYDDVMEAIEQHSKPKTEEIDDTVRVGIMKLLVESDLSISDIADEILKIVKGTE